jgi:large subunit ribosomal protein L29
MKRLETKDLQKLSHEDLIKKLNELRTEFSKLKSGAARGTLKKELGEIKTVRRNVARVLTAINSLSRSKETTGERKSRKGNSDSTPQKDSS